MVLPLSYFIQTPFQNWTRERAALIGTALTGGGTSRLIRGVRRRASAARAGGGPAGS